MQIKAKTLYDFDTAKALARLSIFGKNEPKKRMIRNMILSAILVLLPLVMIFVYGGSWMQYSFCGLGVWMTLLNGYLYFVFPRILFHNMKNMKNTEVEYCFGDDAVVTASKNAEYSGESTLAYTLFVKAFETSAYWFLYQTNNQVFVVDKSTVTGGTVEELRAKLSSYLDKKYILCNY